MKILSIIAIFTYTLLFSIIGSILIALSLRTQSLDLAINAIEYLLHAENIRMILALTGSLLILINISIAQLSIGKSKKHKTIAFENPYGQVTLSLSAIEDYIKKLTNKMTEIKEIKTNITASKAGIEIVAKTILYSGINIPEATEKIQNVIRLRLQEILGIEGKVSIKIHITKIVQREKLDEQSPVKEEVDSSGFKGEIEYGK